MGSVAYLDQINRAVRVEVLPDFRIRVTRRYDITQPQAVVKDVTQFDSKVKIAWGTPDEDYPECRLVSQNETGQIDNDNKKPNDPPPYLLRVFEQIPENDRVIVGLPGVNFDQYGRKTVVINYVQFSAGTTPYTDTVGVTPAPAPNAGCILKSVEGENNGTVITTKLAFIDAGELSDNEELKFNGKLLLRTLVYLNEIPPTPSGYTLVTTSTEFIQGLPVYRYGFTNGNAGGGGSGNIISDDTQYSQSKDLGVTGVTTRTIQQLSLPSVTVNPIATPAGFTLIDVKYSDEDGYRMWTARYAKGVGLVVDDVTTQQSGALIVYHRVSLDTAPTTPSATIGGTVTLFESSVRNADGYNIYDYRWAEGNGQSSISTQGQGDGALVYNVTTTSVAPATPAYPGSGTAYLVNLTQRPDGGYYVNTAVYHKPPATVTLKQTTQFEKPGAAVFTGSPPQLVLTPPVTLTLLADMEVSYNTAQITDAPFSVATPASFYEAYTPTATGIPVTSTQSLGRYLAGASVISGTASYYNGVLCDTWQATLVSSTPSSFTTGTKVLHTNNEIYLVATDGTVVYRRTKVSYTF